MATVRVTGAVLVDIPGTDASGAATTHRVTGAVLLDIPDPSAQFAALIAAVTGLGTKLDALTAAVSADSGGALVS